MKVLIACECSQTVCAEFRRLGVECYSCDIEQEYGGHPEWHIKGDVLGIIDGDCAFVTTDGVSHYVDRWDLVIAHPPCTYLSGIQNGLYNPDRLGEEYVSERKKKREEGIKFFMKFTRIKSPCLIENPIGCMSTRYRKPNQVIQPWMFGDSATKATCLWLFRLPNLIPTKIVDPGGKHYFEHSCAMGLWYYNTSKYPAKERSRFR